MTNKVTSSHPSEGLVENMLELAKQSGEDGAVSLFLSYLLSMVEGAVEAVLCLLDTEGQHFVRYARLSVSAPLVWDDFPHPLSIDKLEHPLSYCLRLGKPLVLEANTFFWSGELMANGGGEVAILPVHVSGYHAVCYILFSAGENRMLPEPLATQWEIWVKHYAHLQVSWQRLAHARQQLRNLQEQQSQVQKQVQQVRRKGLQLMQQSLLGNTTNMQQLRADVARIAGSSFNVLVRGETGTGKELVVRELHRMSSAATGELVAVNCAAIPEGLLESELFGHVKGAFSGAETTRDGLLGAARDGTLFLDEIGDMPLGLQAKLLRVLQEGCYRPLGCTDERHIHFRLVAATHQPLEQLVAQGAFRQDFYYRLKQAVVHIPPLRERNADIPLLARHFIKEVCQEQGWSMPVLQDEAVMWLQEQVFAGNVRELKYLIRQAVLGVQGQSSTIEVEQLRRYHLPLQNKQESSGIGQVACHKIGLKAANVAFEMDYIRRVLVDSGGKRSIAACRLGIPLRTLAYKCLKYGID